MAKQRADDLRKLPLRDCDVILHEAGAPPIHTPLAVLLKLPEYVKKRLYVVHTSALPKDCPLRVAPAGTIGTIRLDADYEGSDIKAMEMNRTISRSLNNRIGDPQDQPIKKLPLISFRPTSVSDAWFILNLLSNVPFLSSLSYSATMEVLEVSEVKVFNENDVVIPAEDRSNVLCVVWEGTLMERLRDDCMSINFDDEQYNHSETNGDDGVQMNGVSNLSGEEYSKINNSYRSLMITPHNFNAENTPTVWYAGDWTGPTHLQPDAAYAGDANLRRCVLFSDIVAVSAQGAKVIIVVLYSSLNNLFLNII